MKNYKNATPIEHIKIHDKSILKSMIEHIKIHDKCIYSPLGVYTLFGLCLFINSLIYLVSLY